MDDKDEFKARLAYWVQYYRTKQGLSQMELAVRVGIDTRQIGRIEQKVNTPSVILAYHIAKILKVKVDSLLQPIPDHP